MTQDYALEAVPENNTVSGFRIALVCIGSIIALPAFMSGAEIGFALGFRSGSLAIFIGGALLGIIAVATGAVAAKTRLNTAMITKLTFGASGGKIVSAVLALTLLGWFGVTAELFGRGVYQVVSDLGWKAVPTTVYAVTGGTLMVVTTIFGFQALQRLSNVTVPLLAVLIGYTAWLTLRAAPVGALSAPGLGTSGFGDAISAIVGGLAAGVTIFPDLCRFSRTARDAAIAAVLAFALAMPTILLVAMIPSVLLHQRDLILIMTSVGLGVPALALLIVKAWATNAANLYSASLSTANFLSSRRQKWIVIGGGIVGTLLAVSGISDRFIPFLLTLSVAIPPIAGIYTVDVLWLGALERHSADDAAVPNIRYSAFACWGFGISVAIAARAGFMTFTGVSAGDSILAAAISYVIVRKVARQTGRG